MPNADTSLHDPLRPSSHPSLHIYQRALTTDTHDSLSIIASLITPGQTLLDLGMGAGTLGKFLSSRQPIEADGVSLNPAEADLARKWYRKALVADLDQVDLAALFGDKQYDCIVCADVLEHLKEPQRILAQARSLLAPGGRLITSIPNAGYCGLVAELMQGDFRYRPEGLLDATHLRFFTNASLRRFFVENEWEVMSVTAVQRSLVESEFQVAFDSLPPAVARYLLAVPDALTYQFVSVLQPRGRSGHAGEASVPLQTPIGESQPASAHFSAELLLATQFGYTEALKLVTTGRIGSPRQVLTFDIAASAEPYTCIRLDPADRPGFFRLHDLSIRLPSGLQVWQWKAERDAIDILVNARCQDIVFGGLWDVSIGALLLLHSDDPWIELPLSADILGQISDGGAILHANVGWPMSADYLQASMTMDAIERQSRQIIGSQKSEIQRLSQHLSELDLASQAKELELNTEVFTLTQRVQAAHEEKQFLIGDLRFAQREHTTALQQFNQISDHVKNIEKSLLFRATRPLSHAKGRIDRLLGKGGVNPSDDLHASQSRPAAQAVPLPSHPVDIIVPVYRGLDDTRCCLESVLASKCQAAWRLIVINDCSPETEVTEWLRALAANEPRITLLENAENLGFVATVNRGMALSDQNDVVLLNSDTEVANDWLDRLQIAAHSTQRVASVTPFSNNATIFSYPRFCESNAMPIGIDTAGLDRLFAHHLNGQTTEVPTAVGFCMYVRRQCLQEVGLFDVETFGKGYGEENDFCVRAHNKGWVNLHALDVFVRHAGGVSFGDSKSERELAAMQTLRQLHPRYESDVQAFIQRDPAADARLSIDIARITHAGRPVILNVMHDREGGTLRHVRELAARLSQQATFLQLAPRPGGVELKLDGRHEAFSVQFQLPADQEKLLGILRRFQVGHIHFHHLLGHASNVCELPAQLGVSHDFTAHDFHSYCPQITLTDHTDRYCGERGIDQCRQCVKKNPAPGGESIEGWRDRHTKLLSQGRYVITPSQDTAHRIQRFVPTARVQAVAHATLDTQVTNHPAPQPPRLGAHQPLKIVVLGALGKVKGADVLEDAALLAVDQNALVEFHLLGYAYRNLKKLPKARLTVHGSYDDEDLPELLQWLKPDLIWFPALWPETYSYTLSASLASGLPIVAPNLGAFGERLVQRDWTWLCDWDQTAKEWLGFFDQIRQQNFCTGTGPKLIAAPAFLNSATQAQSPLDRSKSFSYQTTYVESLKPVAAFSPQEVKSIRLQLEPNLSRLGNREGLRADAKSAALRILVRLRASPALAWLTKRIPIKLQTRMKSWLRK
jgi:O-antigen biosynthesis protein